MILIALGANLPSAAGAPSATIEAALATLGAAGAPALAHSRLYRSAPVPPSAQPDYVNAAARLETALGPEPLLRLMLAIEARFGRVRGARDAARTLDLDLIAYGARIIDAPGLAVPHPRLAERAFVLVPLAEIAPDWRHPRFGLTIAELVARLSPAERQSVSAF